MACDRPPGASRRALLKGTALLLAGQGACTRPAPPALRIGTNVWIGSEPLYLARELAETLS